VCYVQRAPQEVTIDRNKNQTNSKTLSELYDDNFLDSVTLSRWQQKRIEMRANSSSTKSFKADGNVMTHLDISDGLKTGLKRPSNGTILPVTYLKVYQEDSTAGHSYDHRTSTPVLQEYVCY
jgi:hypothetical protein